MKGVSITRAEILKAYADLLKYYEAQATTDNTKAVTKAIKEILKNDYRV